MQFIMYLLRLARGQHAFVYYLNFEQTKNACWALAFLLLCTIDFESYRVSK